MISRQLSHGWEFIRMQLSGPWEVWRSQYGVVDVELPWKEVTLPHCFTAMDCVDPVAPYYQGEAWYRTRLTIDNPFPCGRTLLRFAGAGQRTDIFVMTTSVGSHAGGYDAFEVDLTDAIKHGSSNSETSFPLAIRCSNKRDVELIPSDLSDFTLHGGVYRPVELSYVPAISIANGTVHPHIIADRGEVSVALELRNPEMFSDEVEYEVSVVAADESIVACSAARCHAWKGEQEISILTVPRIRRWSVDAPVLYKLKIVLRSCHGETTIEKRFGFRSFSFKPEGPFYLNDSRLLLRGTHRHEDHAGVGAAMTEEQILAEMRLIKEMGVNFIRLGHYQQSEYVLDLCDELGILVWEEIPWCRGGVGNETYKFYARNMLERMIRQHHHHPAVILWGLGNENDWPGDFEEFEAEPVRAFMTGLHTLAKSLDPERMTCIRRCDFCKDIVDVYSPSIWAGWYRGNYRQYRDELEVARRDAARFIHVEWGADCHAGRHAEDPYENIGAVVSNDGVDERTADFLHNGGECRVSRDGDWSETYCCDLIDWHLKEQASLDWFAGSAYWSFKDFSTPLRPNNPVPYVNQKGVVQRDLQPKESYYVFQSYWASRPMLRIYGHSWKYRWGSLDEARLIRVYSNCSEVELFLNEQSLGIKKRDQGVFPCSGLSWQSSFREGQNILKALARLADGTVLGDEVEFNFLSEIGVEPARILIKSERSGEGTMIRLNAFLIDKQNRLCTTSRNVMSCQVFGEGRQIINLGVMGGASVVEAANGHAFWHIEKHGNPLYAVVRSPGLPPAYHEILGETTDAQGAP